VVALTLIGLLGVPSYSALLGFSLKVQSVEVGGINGNVNNVVFAFERYALMTPFGPSNKVTDYTDLSQFDNNKLIIADTKSVRSDPVSVSLGSCYYPTNVAFDQTTQTAFVRGTSYEKLEDGEFESHEVIAYVSLSLDENGKPIADPRPVHVAIPGRDGKSTTSEAPSDIAIAHKGQFLLFTNGVRLFSFNVQAGFLYQFDIFQADQYGPDSYISFNGFDPESNTLVVSHNTREQVTEEKSVRKSALWFYRIEPNGTLTNLRIVLPGAFASGRYLTEGSVVGLTSSNGEAEFAYLVTDDGTLCQIDLRRDSGEGGLFGDVKALQAFPDLAQSDPDNVEGARIVTCQPETQNLWIVRPGESIINIRRPVFGRPSRSASIRRPVFIQAQENPALVLAQVNNKKTKVAKTRTLTEIFQDEIGISGLVFQNWAQGLVSTRTGKLFAVDFSGDIRDASVEVLGDIGKQVDYLTFNPSRASVVAIDSETTEADEEGNEITRPGSMVVVTRKESKNGSVASIAQLLKVPSNALGGLVPSIRRPCNLGR
jgi:hypothetical protein